MKLISLTSNMPSFHSVIFKEGVNIILGKQASPTKGNDGNTYNGVGKSFIIHLIHFCLGSNKIDSFESNLSNWSYTLKFSVDGKEYISTRHADEQNKLIFCGEKIPLKTFRAKLLSLCFNIEETPNYMTWNTLFSRFARRYRSSYINFDTFVPKETDYSKLLNNGYLLDIDYELIVKKRNLRDKQTSANKTEKAIKKDPVFKQYYLGKHDADIDVTELNYKITQLQSELNSFKVSSNYHELEKEANDKSFSKKKLENKRALINSNIKNITISLNQSIDVNADQLLTVYKTAKVEIPDMIKEKIDNVMDFHNELLKSREIRLKKELQKNNTHLSSIEIQIKELGEEMDRLLSYLNSHGALEEYLALTERLSSLEHERNRINDYKKILKTYQETKLDIKADFISQDKESDIYLEGQSDYIDWLKESFRNLAKKFYPKKSSGLIIKNNFGENQLRFNIDARIEDDSSDGVNEVKIFCFDLLILLSKVSNMRFLIHDSRLLANMDPRQREILFRLMNEYTETKEFQYICSVNEDTLQSIEPLMKKNDYEDIIEKNIVLELNDDSPESKLLGVQVDIDLEGNNKK